MKIPVSFRTSYARADKQILVDSGATDNFIDPRLLKRLGLRSLRLERPRKIWNIDGTNNRAGMISDYVDLNVQSGNKGTKMRFLVTDLGLEDLILGYPWLAYFEPKFSWKEGVIDTTHLPIIIRSLSWHQTTQTIVSNATVARIVTDSINDREKDQIVQDVTDLQGPPSERTPEQKLWDFKTRAQQYARDQESCDDTRISYLEFLETEAEDDLALTRMIAG
jgi:hypothetical protein